MQRFNAGFQSAQYRTTANSIFTVIKGSGRTIVDGEVMEWALGDVIAVPAWRTYSHAVDSESFMVRASDEPVMRSIDMLRSRSDWAAPLRSSARAALSRLCTVKSSSANSARNDAAPSNAAVSKKARTSSCRNENRCSMGLERGRRSVHGDPGMACSAAF